MPSTSSSTRLLLARIYRNAVFFIVRSCRQSSGYRSIDPAYLAGVTQNGAGPAVSVAMVRAILTYLAMAEGVGFEPTRLFTPSHFRDDRTRPTMRPLQGRRPHPRAEKYTIKCELKTQVHAPFPCYA